MSWKCDFCKYHAPPYKPGNEKCVGCSGGKDMFVVRKFMHPRTRYDWEQHQKLEKFIDDLDIRLLQWQRGILHHDLERRLSTCGPTRFINARGCGRSNQQLNLDILMCEFYISMLKEEKEKNHEKIHR